MALPSCLQPRDADQDREHAQWHANLRVIPESDGNAVSAGYLDDDEIGNRAYEGEVARERRGHSDRQPGPMWVRQISHEWFEDKDRRDVADEVRQCGCDKAQ